MICNKCGRELPDGARVCDYCGAVIGGRDLRHARPEESYSFSDETAPADIRFDDLEPMEEQTELLGDPVDGGRTKKYNFELFEDHPAPTRRRTEKRYDRREEPDDSYDDYNEDDDLTLMDKIDRRFRRNDDDRPRRNSRGLWIVLGIVGGAVVLIMLILLVSGALSGNSSKVKEDKAKATVYATVAPTQAPAPTMAQAISPTNPVDNGAVAPTDPLSTEPEQLTPTQSVDNNTSDDTAADPQQVDNGDAGTDDGYSGNDGSGDTDNGDDSYYADNNSVDDGNYFDDADVTGQEPGE